MKQMLLSCTVVLVCSLLFFAFLFNKKDEMLPPLTSGEITPELLFERFTSDENYKEYPYWPGHPEVQPGQSPHGAFHEIYVHPVLAEALPVPDRRAPDGSIVVKCNLDSDRELISFTVMAKVEGYNPEAGDWYWAVYTKDGRTEAAGRIQSCIECHEALWNNDYLIVHPLDRELR
jgi:hypothetical protein